MRGHLRSATDGVVFMLLVVFALYGLSWLYLATQRVSLRHLSSDQLLRSGFRSERGEDGSYRHISTYFWGSVESSECDRFNLLGDLRAKSGLSSWVPDQNSSGHTLADSAEGEGAKLSSVSGSAWYCPLISLEEAMAQAGRVSQARGLAEEKIEGLVQRHAEGSLFGLLGLVQVNVWDLNQALDQIPGG